MVVSLLYVGLQIRQNTRATRLAAVRAVEETIGSTELMIIGSDDFATLLKRGLAESPADMHDVDRIRLNVFYRHILRAYQSAHYHYRQAVLEKSVWEPQARALAAIFQADRGLREHFAVEKYMLDPAFAGMCEELLQQGTDWRLTSAHAPLKPQDQGADSK